MFRVVALTGLLLLSLPADAGRQKKVEDLCAPPSGTADVVVPAEPEAPLPSGEAPAKPPPLAPVRPLVVSRVSKAGKRIALTFDACSVRHCSEYDERITEVLKETHTPATIFIGGRWAAQQRVHVKELAALPDIEFGNHTWSHPPMTRRTSALRREELLKTQQELFALTGKQPTLFRPPYGQYDEAVVKEAAELGLTTVEYDLASGDPDRTATKERLTRWVLRKARPGSIIVMHINRRGWHTAEALPAIVAGLRKQHYELVTVGELLKYGPPDASPSLVMNVGGRPPKKSKPTAVTH